MYLAYVVPVLGRGGWEEFGMDMNMKWYVQMPVMMSDEMDGDILWKRKYFFFWQTGSRRNLNDLHFLFYRFRATKK